MARHSIFKLGLTATISAFAIAGCTKPQTKENQFAAEMMEQNQILPASRAERDAIKSQDMITQTAFWSSQFELNPGDYEAGLAFAKSLRGIGSSQRSAEVASQALSLHPGDAELSKALARAAMDQARPDVAVSTLFVAIPKARDDWELMSLYGVALDNMGNHKEAQASYDTALKLSPMNSTVMSNLGLSYLMQGEYEMAESILRRAMSQSNQPDPRIRQNLALVLGVQGRFDESAELTGVDLPPNMVAENMAYYRKLLTPDRKWSALRGTQD